MAQAPQKLLARDGRLHLQEGPIDLVIRAWGDPPEVAAAYAQASSTFDGLLRGLVAELDLLRRPLGTLRPEPVGPVARRMVEAVWPYRHRFITPMAAVAGAVADHVLEAMTSGRRLDRAFVNDGGDVALFLAPGRSLRLGMVDEIDDPHLDGLVELRAEDPVRGVATSGAGGRSFSLGIADAVTVLARDAAAADAAATIIANAVDVDHPAVLRRPARELDPDSDLGDIPVTVAVGDLDAVSVAAALEAGFATAREVQDGGLIEAAALRLRGQHRILGLDPHRRLAGSKEIRPAAALRTSRR